VRNSTTAALIVAEAMHAEAGRDVRELLAAVAGELDAVWSAAAATSVLSPGSRRFAFGI
jgi:DNA/RNA-binding domain of Phe-tRNA-synthetase-like protein